MNATEANTDDPADDATRPPAKFQFSLLEFLVLTTLISIAIGLTSRFAGVDALWALVVGTVFVSVLCVSAHFVAEWLLTPPEKRSYIWATPVFWLAVGFVLLAMTASAFVEAVDRSTDPENPGFSLGFLLCLITATACSFITAAYRWRRMKRPTSIPDTARSGATIE